MISSLDKEEFDMKKEYEKPVAEVVNFQPAEEITTVLGDFSVEEGWDEW